MNIRLYAVKLDRPLSEAERSTLARFLPPERQDRIKTSEPLCAYALLCRALHELYGLEDLPQLSCGEHGKPYFASHPDVHFSLSHTRGAALLAVHNEPIGADIECLRPVSGAMRTRFHAANDADFWRLWVQRESRCKRAGISAVALRDREVPIFPNERVFALEPFPDYTASVCTCSDADVDKLIYLTVKSSYKRFRREFFGTFFCFIQPYSSTTMGSWCTFGSSIFLTSLVLSLIVEVQRHGWQEKYSAS